MSVCDHTVITQYAFTVVYALTLVSLALSARDGPALLESHLHVWVSGDDATILSCSVPLPAAAAEETI